MATVEVLNGWVDRSGKTLMKERRRMRFFPLDDRQWLLVIELELEPAADDLVTLGKTPFGLIGVRVATSLSVQDGGGLIRNSEHATNEKQVFGQHAKWVDYSGLVAPHVPEGVTLMDHLDNPRHPVRFHVRDDGWMGASLTYDAPYSIEHGRPLRLRYGLCVHTGVPTHQELERRYHDFVQRADPRFQ